MIKKANGATAVHSVSADVSDRAPVQSACEKAVKLMGGLDSVICCAGASHPALFIATPEEDFERLMRINYTGIVYTLKTCVPHLIRNGGGRIMIVSSMAGLSGIAGFTAYSASKFALRGLAESLHMELNETYNISVSLCNPPDVNTPMLAKENLIKPKECRLISEGSGTFEAEQIANDMVEALKNWKFLVNTGMDGNLLALIASGTAPAHSGVWGTIELLSLGILRVVSTGYRWYYTRLVKQVHQERVQGKLDDAGATAHKAIVNAK
ncbi:MAG: SDR family NAD(P)-dependent oxidoreductase [Tumebacillaceae bacterium]